MSLTVAPKLCEFNHFSETFLRALFHTGIYCNFQQTLRVPAVPQKKTNKKKTVRCVFGDDFIIAKHSMCCCEVSHFTRIRMMLRSVKGSARVPL